MLAQLLALGVPADPDVEVRCAPINVRFGGLFDFAETGPLAVLVPVDPEAPNDADLVAFFPDRPMRWWTNAGAPILNFEAVRRAEWFDRSLRLHASVLGYLRARGDGAVVLDSRADLRFWLAGIGTVIVDNARFGRDIERRLRQPSVRIPRIALPAAVKAA